MRSWTYIVEMLLEGCRWQQHETRYKQFSHYALQDRETVQVIASSPCSSDGGKPEFASRMTWVIMAQTFPYSIATRDFPVPLDCVRATALE